MRILPLVAALGLMFVMAGCEARSLQASSLSANPRGFLSETTFSTALLVQGQWLWEAEEMNNQNGFFEPKNSPKSLRAHSKTQQKEQSGNRALVDMSQAYTVASANQESTALQQQPVKLVFLGDIMLGRYVRELMEENGLDYPFEKMDESYLRENDALVVNLEGPVTSRAMRHTEGMVFGFFPDTVELLKKHHVDVVSQANNHTLDKQQKGYEESMTLLRQGGLTAFGHQRDINNDTVAQLEIKGKKLALVGLEEVMSPIDDTKAVQLITQLKQEGYRVIVYPHWGTEYQNLPNSRQKELAHAFIDAGAYAIIGHHPHVPQAYENYNGHPIFYSLGNAIFDQYWSAQTQEGLSVVLEITEESNWITGNNAAPSTRDQLTITLVPLSIHRSQMAIMEGEQRQSFLERFAGFGEHQENEREELKRGIMTLTIPFNS